MFAGPALNPDAEHLRSGNAVMGGRGYQPHHVDSFRGPLSIKFMIDGAGVWRSSAGVHVVEDRHFLVLNHGERYSLDIEGGTLRESFCPFFAPGFVEDVERGLTSSADRLLETPTTDGTGAPFHQHLHGPDRRVVPALERLHRAVHAPHPDEALLCDGFTALAEALLLHQRRDLALQIGRVPAARAATRAECHRRVSRARDYLHAHAAEPLTLARLAREAALSPYHFHRLFRAVHGVPPLHYLRNLRLSRARRLLRDSPLSVTAVALAVGFESPAAFTTRFTRATGMAPSHYRQQCRAGVVELRKNDKAATAAPGDNGAGSADLRRSRR